MATCINRNHPNFKQISEANNNNDILANILIDNWQQRNNTDIIPTLEELKGKSFSVIKPGVEELFDSNPELPSQVYEALGFENLTRDQFNNITNMNSDINNGWKLHLSIKGVEEYESTEDSTPSKEIEKRATKTISILNTLKNRNLIQDYKIGNDGGQPGKNITVYIGNSKTIDEVVKILSTDELRESNIEGNLSLAKGISARFDSHRNDLKVDSEKYKLFRYGVNGIPNIRYGSSGVNQYSNEEIPYSLELLQASLGSYFNSSSIINNKLNKLYPNTVQISSQITPQQKQQALQQYSQYLDTIFPDSKVKDIVYHGTEDKFDKFDIKYFGKNDFGDLGKGFYFAFDKASIFNEPIVVSAIVNDTNSKQSPGYEIMIPNAEQIHILGNKQDIEGFKEFVGKKNNLESFQKDKEGKVIKVESSDELIDWLKQNNIITKQTKKGDWLLKVSIDATPTGIQTNKNLDKLKSIKGKNIIRINKTNEKFKETFKTNLNIIEPNLLNSGIVKFNKEALTLLNSPTINFQLSSKDTENFIPDEQLDSRIREFCTKLGIKVNIDSVLDAEGNPIPDVVARAKFVRENLSAIIDIAQNKQGYDTLTEEAVHFLVWMMRGTPLYNSMINDVIKTDTYKQVKKEYANVYSSEIQFKEEAITKLITESVIQQHQKGTKLTFDEYTNINNRINRWFNKVMSFIKDLLAKYSVNEYDVAAMKLLFNDTSDLSLNNINNNEEMYQLETNDISSKINDAINKIKSRHIKRDSNHKYSEDGFEYSKSVTEYIQRNKQFPDRSPSEKEQDEFARKIGDLGHADFNNSLKRAIELKEIGSYKTAIEIYTNPSIRSKIDTLVDDIVSSYGENARFLTEQMIGDKSKDIAGAFDFLVVYEKNNQVEAEILDFKFTQFKKEKSKVIADEIPAYKKKDYQEQLKTYKNILQNAYGLKFNINASLIPIGLNTIKKDNNWFLTGVEIGSTKFNEEKKYLNPIPLETNKTGNDSVDSIVAGLVAQKNIITKQEPETEEEKNKKIIRLKSINATIKKIILTKDLEEFFNEAKFELDNILSGNITPEKLEAAGEILPFYKNLNFSDYISSFSEDKELQKTAVNNLGNFLIKIQKIEKIYNENLDKIADSIGEKLGVDGINIPQKDIGWWSKILSYFSSSQNPHIQSLYKLWISAKDTARLAFEKDLTEIEKLHKDVLEYASKNGIESKNAYKFMLKRDKFNNLILIDKFSKEARKKINKAREEKNYSYLKKVLEFDEKKYLEKYEQDKAFYEKRYEGDNKKIKQMLELTKKQFDVRKSEYALLNKNNRFVKLNEKEVEKSSEYEHIQKTPELKAFYDYFVDKVSNTRKELGLEYDYKFVPQIGKSIIEAITDDDTKFSFGDNFWNSVSTNKNGSYGEVNVLTGNVEYQISMPYQTKIGENSSADLGKVLALWSKAAHDTNQLKKIETSSKILLQHLEKQEFYLTDFFGDPKTKKDSQDLALVNAENSNTLSAYISYMQEAIYGVQNANGMALPKTRKRAKRDSEGNVVKDENGNIVMEEYELPVSVDKLVQKVLSYISGNALGFNVISAGANLGGGLANGYYIAHQDKFYNKKQFTNAIRLFSAGSMNLQTKALLRYFDITGNMEGFNKANALSVSAADRFLTYDKLYTLQKKGDDLIHNTILLSLLQSHGISENGKIKLLSKLPEGTKSLLESTEIKEDEIYIKGLTDNKDKTEYLNFRRKAHELSKKIVGVSPDHDIRLANQTIMGRILMQFRNWLPRMAEERFMIGTRFNKNLDDFEKGRYISFVQFLNKNITDGMLQITKSYIGIGGNFDEVLSKKWELLNQETKNKYLNNTANEAEAKASFISTEKANLKATVLELQLMSLLFAALMLLNGGDDDDDKSPVKKMLIAMTDRLHSELSFFVLPPSFLTIIKSPVAASSTLNDSYNIVEDIIGQTVGFITNDEDRMDKNKPLKRTGKMFPLLKEGIKDFDIMFDDSYLDNIKSW
jgi:hypothetical protein